MFVSLFESRDPNSILDLGSGGGSLATNAVHRWPGAQLTTIDLDIQAKASIESCLHTHLIADAYDPSLPEITKNSPFDLLICNPPYVTISSTPGIGKMLKEAGFADQSDTGPVNAEIVFIAQIIRMAAPGAEIGLIIPDGLVSGARATRFRRDLLQSLYIKKVVQLPRGSFEGTDAIAYIVIATNELSFENHVELTKWSHSDLSPSMFITHEAAAERMDYDFHASRAATLLDPPMTLKKLGAVVVRGSISPTEAKLNPSRSFHTTHFNQSSPVSYTLSDECDEIDRPALRVAGPGDILLARVDRALHRKICLVAKGRAVLSDMVYAIRVPGEWRIRVIRGLLADNGQKALLSASRGTGARMLSKEALMNIEI